MSLPASIKVLVILVFILVLIEKGKSDLTVLNDLESLFNSNVEENEKFESEEHWRVKRADVSQIRHLYDEARVNPHSQAEKDAILAKHREYRSSTIPEASNMEYMVSSIIFILRSINKSFHLAELFLNDSIFGTGF